MNFDFWQPLAGIGLFLFAMRQIEASLEQASGRNFRAFVRHSTASPLKGVIGGTVVTAVLQSSSLVGLMMLALVGAGVVQMRNALAVIFGANLGTTFTGWIVATIGFKLNLDALALPLVGLGGLIYIATRQRTLHQSARFALSLGLLLMGISFMKSSVDDLGAIVDIESFRTFGPLEFLLFGTLFSAVVQSSSATMAVTLSALYGGVIDLPSAAAVAIGADLGTTSTVLLGAVKGSAAKKRVAAGHFLFNLVTDILAFVLRTPLLAVIALVGVGDSLIALVAFHSLFNLMGIALFFPVIDQVASFLERRFDDSDSRISRHLGMVAPAVPESSVEAVELETAHLLQRVIRQNLLVFDPPLKIAKGRLPIGPLDEATVQPLGSGKFVSEYQTTKRLEGEILEFTLQTQTAPLEESESGRIDRCQRAVREAVHAAKTLKDIEADLRHFETASDARLIAYGQRFRDVLTEFYLALYTIRDSEEDTPTLDDIVGLTQLLHRGHDELHRTIYTDIRLDRLPEEDISSLLNANRELYASCKSLVGAIAVLVLPTEQVTALETLPGSLV